MYVMYSEGLNKIKGLAVNVASVETNIVSTAGFSSEKRDPHYFTGIFSSKLSRRGSLTDIRLFALTSYTLISTKALT